MYFRDLSRFLLNTFDVSLHRSVLHTPIIQGEKKEAGTRFIGRDVRIVVRRQKEKKEGAMTRFTHWFFYTKAKGG